MLLGGAAAGLVVHGCKPEAETKTTEVTELQGYSYKYGRTPKEKEEIIKLKMNSSSMRMNWKLLGSYVI